MKDLKIKKGDKYYPYGNSGVVGTFVNRGITYRFNAVVMYEPSFRCINCGRVYKLWVTNEKTDKIVFQYENILIIRGTEAMTQKGMIKELVDYLEVYAVEAWEAMFVR